MPDTDVFEWPMPVIGGSSGTWGTELNELFDDHIEETVNTVKTTADGALQRSGGAMTGEVQIHTERYDITDRGSMSGTAAFSVDDSNVQYGTVTGDVTVSFTDWPTSGTAVFLTLEITNGNAFTITWPGAIVWDGGSAPTLQNSGVDILVFYSRDGGTTVRGMHAGSFNS